MAGHQADALHFGRRLADQVDRRRRDGEARGRGRDLLAPGGAPARSDRARAGSAPGAPAPTCASACRTRRGPAGAGRRRPAAARSRWRHAAAFQRQRLDERDAEREAGLGVVGQALLGGAVDQRVEIGQAAQRLGGDGVGEGRGRRRAPDRARRRRARIRAAGPCEAPRRAGCRAARRVAVPGGSARFSRAARADRARSIGGLSGARGGGGVQAHLARPSPRARRSGSRCRDGSRTGCRRGRGRARCRARRRPGCAPRPGSGSPAAPRASLASAEASARGLP